MCLLIKLDGEWPSDAILRAGVAQNKDGIGIAFSDGEKVQYYKGITFERLMEFKGVVTRGLIHFRMTSSGPTIPQLCHPFPISKRTGLHLEGRVNQVLAHNGHWGKWEDMVWNNLGHAPMPKGAMSDTRAMAWLTGIHGMGFLRLLNEKVLVVTSDYIYQFGKGWEPQPKNQGYQLSYNPLSRGKWAWSDDDAYGYGSATCGGQYKGGTTTYKSFESWEAWQKHREEEAAGRKATTPTVKPEANIATNVDVDSKLLPAVLPTLTETIDIENLSSLSDEEYDQTVADYIATSNPSTHWSEETNTIEIIDNDNDLEFVPDSGLYAG